MALPIIKAPDMEQTNKLLWWIVGVLVMVIGVGGTSYLTFVAKAVDEIRTDISQINLKVATMSASALTKGEVRDMIESSVRFPWDNDKALVMEKLSSLENRHAKTEAKLEQIKSWFRNSGE